MFQKRPYFRAHTASNMTDCQHNTSRVKIDTLLTGCNCEDPHQDAMASGMLVGIYGTEERGRLRGGDSF